MSNWKQHSPAEGGPACPHCHGSCYVFDSGRAWCPSHTCGEMGGGLFLDEKVDVSKPKARRVTRNLDPYVSSIPSAPPAEVGFALDYDSYVKRVER